MADKYHNEWIIRDIVTDARIFHGQSRALRFLSDMAYDLDDAIGMLEGVRSLPAIDLQLDLLERKLFYLKTANGIGDLWAKSEPKGASGA